ncbi:MAG TPA: PfkB family carbohydrate kinase [Casimicrobium sp.]|nr:PfkB family carbohydrate kinase [Casimicrobium sp.]
MSATALTSTCKRARVICVGVATLDQIFRVDVIPEAPAKFGALEFIVTGGGMAANAAVAVQRLGGEAQYWGRVGDDEVGDQIVHMLEREHVNVLHVFRLPGARSKTAAILVDKRGERLICSAPAQGYPPDTSWLPLHEVRSAQAVHADTRWKPGATVLFNAAADAGIPSVFDADGGEAEDALAVATLATHPVFGEALLGRLGLGAPDEALPRVFGGRNVIAGVTLGERGVVWFDGKALHRMSSPHVNAIDTLAAGDTWHGALALALAERQPLRDAISFASDAAALKCTRFGGRVGIPTRDELNTFRNAIGHTNS